MSAEQYPHNFVLDDEEGGSAPILDRSLSERGPVDKHNKEAKNRMKRISDQDLLISIQSPDFVNLREKEL